MNISLSVSERTDKGKVREKNEDFYGSLLATNFSIFVVCDGIGGYRGGDLAAKIAVESIIEKFKELNETDFDIKEQIRKAIEYANDNILDNFQKLGLVGGGTTVVLLLIKDNKAYITNLGDSRAYLIRKSRIKQVTKDHSLAIEIGNLPDSLNQNIRYFKKNVITRSLGEKQDFSDLEIIEIDINVGDILFLCTDGLTNMIQDQEILKTLKTENLHSAAEKLIRLANYYGGYDNITLQIIKVNKRKIKFAGISKMDVIMVGFLIFLAYSLFILNKSLFNFSLRENEQLSQTFTDSIQIKTEEIKERNNSYHSFTIPHNINSGIGKNNPVNKSENIKVTQKTPIKNDKRSRLKNQTLNEQKSDTTQTSEIKKQSHKDTMSREQSNIDTLLNTKK